MFVFVNASTTPQNNINNDNENVLNDKIEENDKDSEKNWDVHLWRQVSREHLHNTFVCQASLPPQLSTKIITIDDG